MADTFIDTMRDLHRKINSLPKPQDTTQQIIDAQKALLEALRTDPKLVGKKMTGNGK